MVLVECALCGRQLPNRLSWFDYAETGPGVFRRVCADWKACLPPPTAPVPTLDRVTSRVPKSEGPQLELPLGEE